MMSCKGFLTPDPNRRPRMTAKQCVAVTKAVHAAIDYWVDKKDASLMPDIAAVVKRVTTSALADYPPDRSCKTCDFHQGSTCLHWKQEVPSDAVEDGCDKHKEQGAPF